MKKQTLFILVLSTLLVSSNVNAGSDWEDIGRGIIFGGITLGLLNNSFGRNHYNYQPPRSQVYVYEENTYYENDYDRPRRHHRRRHHRRHHHHHYNDW